MEDVLMLVTWKLKKIYFFDHPKAAMFEIYIAL